MKEIINWVSYPPEQNIIDLVIDTRKEYGGGKREVAKVAVVH